MPPVTNNLDSYLKTSNPLQPIEPALASQEIRDRGSTFVANIFPATTPSEALSRIAHVKSILHRTKPATHEIAAWRCMVLKPGCTGLGGLDDFEVSVGHNDDGEKWAGARVQKVMESLGILDAVVIVSRWYGGTMLGPARFTHIETCATEVCKEFKRSEELRECLSELANLDAVLAGLRAEYSESSDKPVTTDGAAPKDYGVIDLDKGRRLIKARENSIKSVKILLAKRRGALDAVAGPGDRI
ncbi:hypothetical protein H0H93_015343 [Arthromyces matolae]|nr:hypothetical protein H0H93_015343 [Arthromyces matolae]